MGIKYVNTIVKISTAIPEGMYISVGKRRTSALSET